MTKRIPKKNTQLQIVEPTTKSGRTIPPAAQKRSQRIWAWLRREFGRTVH